MIGRIRNELRTMRGTIIWELLRAQGRWILLLAGLSVASFGGFIVYANAIRDAIDKAIVDQTSPLHGNKVSDPLFH